MTEPERYFFVHLQKTGGTALFRRLRNHFGTDAVYPMPEHQFRADAVIDVDYMRTVFEAERDRIRVVTGHFPYCTTELLGVPFRTFTVLRDPVERTLSFLRHQRKLDPDLTDRTLEAIYDIPALFDGLISNHMVRMLSLTPETMTAGALTRVVADDAALERAKANLGAIDVVGVQEHFDEFCDELAARFGWDLGPPQFANRTRPEPASPLLAERIEHDNRLDAELHRFATALCHDRRAARRP